jgi:secreted PhoX family phosphatase
LLNTNPKGGRSSITCLYRCGNACAHEAPNTSDNTYFADVVADVVNRRKMLKAGAVIAVAGAGMAAVGTGTAAATTGRGPGNGPGGGRGTGLDFEPVAPNDLDAVVVPEGYEQGVVIRWGDPVVPGAPRFDFANQTAAAQAKQFGFNNDFCGLVPLKSSGVRPPDPRSHGRYLMVSNHE